MQARWLPCLLLIACSDGLLQVPPPTWPSGARSYVIFFSTSDGTELVGVGAKEPSDAVVRFGARLDAGADGLAIAIAWYPESLAELELVEGPVEAKARPCEIEDPSVIARYQDAQDPGLEWSTGSDLNDVELARLRAERCGRWLCRNFAGPSFSFNDPYRATHLMMKGPSGEVFAAIDEGVILVGADGFVELPRPPSVVHLPTRAGFIQGDEIWLAGVPYPDEGNMLVRGPFDSGFDGALTSTVVPDADGIVEALAPAPGGGLVLAASGPNKGQDLPLRLHVHQDGAWRSQIIDSGYLDNTTNRLAIHWIDEDVAVIVTGGRLLRLDRRTLATTQLWPTTFLNFTTLAHHPEQGFLVGGELGEAYFAQTFDDELERVIAPDNTPVESLIAYEDGFLIGKEGGKLQQYTRGGLSCPDLAPVRFELGHMIEGPGGVVVVGGRNAVAWLTPQASGE